MTINSDSAKAGADLALILYLFGLWAFFMVLVPAVITSRRRFAARAAEDAAGAGALDPSVSGEPDALPAACQGCTLAHLRESIEYWRAEAERERVRANFYYGMVAGDNRRGGGA